MAKRARTAKVRAYQREYQKRWRATQAGKICNQRIYVKRRVRNAATERINELWGLRSFFRLFDKFDGVNMLTTGHIKDPRFSVIVKGKKRTEWLLEPLPTWNTPEGELRGGGRWNGNDFL